MSDILLRFVHISDTHISADPHYNDYDAPHTPLIGAQALVHQLNHLPFAPDFVLHTGDVAYDKDEQSYQAARDILSAINAPVYYLAGNHDDPAALQRTMLGAEVGQDPFEYEFEVNGVQIVTVDSNRPAEAPRGQGQRRSVGAVGAHRPRRRRPPAGRSDAPQRPARRHGLVG